MLKLKEPISFTNFDKGLYTSLNFLNNEKGHSLDCMNVKWNFDGSIQKRYGCSTQNTVLIGSTQIAGWTLETGTGLTELLRAYWKLDETSGNRFDQVGGMTLSTLSSPLSQSGIRGQAADFIRVASQGLFAAHNSSNSVGTGNWTFSVWFYSNSADINMAIASKREEAGGDFSWQLIKNTANQIQLVVSSDGLTLDTVLVADSHGAVTENAWHNVVIWNVTNSHIGISIDLSANTAVYGTTLFASTSLLKIGLSRTDGLNAWHGRIDEAGFWHKFITSTERSELYGGGTGNTYSGVAQSGFGWAMYDFGASSIRWLTVAAGTGIYASSNLGVTFVAVATTRTQNYQYFERSRNVLIATSDSYDRTMYWAGSVGTFFTSLAPNSAPNAKYSINHQGFLILLNYQDSNGTTRKRGFAYADDATQITSTWDDTFDLPSSADDEVTAPFSYGKTLYVSTRYKIFRVSYVGGNPDWSYTEVKQWGYVPRTVQKISLAGEEIVVGMDWSRRLRVFDGVKDDFISNNIEQDNGMCDFAMNKISFSGSGLVVSHAVVDPLEQEYRLNVAIGENSTQTTHAILLNGRSLAFYPYSNQGYQAMCVAESAGRQFLMAVDRSGRVYILNTGNLDVASPIDEHYDSPFMFRVSPSLVTKSEKMDLYFNRDSSGTVYVQDRVDFSSLWTDRKNFELMINASNVALIQSLDIQSIQNTFQYRIHSSSGTANPWRMNRMDFFGWQAGVGKGN